MKNILKAILVGLSVLILLTNAAMFFQNAKKVYADESTVENDITALFYVYENANYGIEFSSTVTDLNKFIAREMPAYSNDYQVTLDSIEETVDKVKSVYAQTGKLVLTQDLLKIMRYLHYKLVGNEIITENNCYTMEYKDEIGFLTEGVPYYQFKLDRNNNTLINLDGKYVDLPTGTTSYNIPSCSGTSCYVTMNVTNMDFFQGYITDFWYGDLEGKSYTISYSPKDSNHYITVVLFRKDNVNEVEGYTTTIERLTQGENWNTTGISYYQKIGLHNQNSYTLTGDNYYAIVGYTQYKFNLAATGGYLYKGDPNHIDNTPSAISIPQIALNINGVNIFDILTLSFTTGTFLPVQVQTGYYYQVVQNDLSSYTTWATLIDHIKNDLTETYTVKAYDIYYDYEYGTNDQLVVNTAIYNALHDENIVTENNEVNNLVEEENEIHEIFDDFFENVDTFSNTLNNTITDPSLLSGFQGISNIWTQLFQRLPILTIALTTVLILFVINVILR